MAGVTVTPYFTPTSITGCSVWLDASDTTTITSSSGTLSQWRGRTRFTNPVPPS